MMVNMTPLASGYVTSISSVWAATQHVLHGSSTGAKGTCRCLTVAAGVKAVWTGEQAIHSLDHKPDMLEF